jgi:small subunit ribosomal protein S10
MATPKQKKQEKIRIRLKAFDHNALDRSVNDILEKAKSSGTAVVGPIPLPTKCEKFTILRSPHVDKKSRDQFEVRTHVRVLELINPTPDTIEKLSKLVIPAGVDLKLHLNA